jgi:hypothetical protein
LEILFLKQNYFFGFFTGNPPVAGLLALGRIAINGKKYEKKLRAPKTLIVLI